MRCEVGQCGIVTSPLYFYSISSSGSNMSHQRIYWDYQQENKSGVLRIKRSRLHVSFLIIKI